MAQRQLKKRIQVDLDEPLLAKLEQVRETYGLTSLTEALRVAIAVASGAPGAPSAQGVREPAFSRRFGGDPFGLDADLESSVRLARLCRRRFYRKPSSEALLAWSELLEEIVTAVPPDHADDPALNRELLRYAAAQPLAWEGLARGVERPAAVAAALQRACRTIPRSDQEDIEDETRARWMAIQERIAPVQTAG